MKNNEIILELDDKGDLGESKSNIPFRSPSLSQRQLRFAETMKKALSQSLLRQDVYHPMFDQVFFSIVEIFVTVDLKIATIYVSFLGLDPVREVDCLEILNSMTVLFKQALSKSMRIKYIPEIRFLNAKKTQNTTKKEAK